MEAVLEQLQGMSVIKSFNLTGKGDQQLQAGAGIQPGEAIWRWRSCSLPYIMGARGWSSTCSAVLILAASVWLCLTGTMPSANALMAVIISFLVFSQISVRGQRRVRPAVWWAAPSTMPTRWTTSAEMDQLRGTDIAPGLPRDCLRPCVLLL
ncbi:MAG: hypothetical protein ACLSAF_20540 [Intestinimonas sp.]